MNVLVRILPALFVAAVTPNVAAQQENELQAYGLQVTAKIKRFIIEPPNLQGNPEIQLRIVILAGGQVGGVSITKASSSPEWDGAVSRAILRAEPLPVPADPELVKHLRKLTFVFRAKP